MARVTGDVKNKHNVEYEIKKIRMVSTFRKRS